MYSSLSFNRCEVYCKKRGVEIFSFQQFRSQLFIAELFYVVLINIVQIFFSVAILVSSLDSQTTWVVVDSIYVGILAFYSGILPFTLGIQIKALSEKVDNEAINSTYYRITILTVLWSIGRFARVYDVFSSVPLWSEWDASFTASNYYWTYIATLYTVMEIIPQSFLLLSAFSSKIELLENPRSLTELNRRNILKSFKKKIPSELLVQNEFCWELEGDLLGKSAHSTVHCGILNHQPVAIKRYVKVLLREIQILEEFCKEILILR